MINVFNIWNVDKINLEAFVVLGPNLFLTYYFNNKWPIGVRFELFILLSVHSIQNTYCDLISSVKAFFFTL